VENKQAADNGSEKLHDVHYFPSLNEDPRWERCTVVGGTNEDFSGIIPFYYISGYQSEESSLCLPASPLSTWV